MKNFKDCYVLPAFSKLEIKILYNALRLMYGDFPEAYKGTQLWENEVKQIMEKFPTAKCQKELI